jgi:hypothetical protein
VRNFPRASLVSYKETGRRLASGRPEKAQFIRSHKATIAAQILAGIKN